ncbi:MAG: OmpA family protein [Treponema sp.]|nr:OmpA family protein [Treponema sp.]
MTSKKKIIAFGLFSILGLSLFAKEKNTSVEAVSSINWITRVFTTKISLDTEKANLVMPSGKKTASTQIKAKMPPLIQPALLSLYEDNRKKLSDTVIADQLSLDQVYHFIMGGYKTPDVFSQDLKNLNTTNTLNLKDLSKELIRHDYAFTPEKPIEYVASRAYTGIVIDARGAYPVHGEYVKSTVSPCLFPQIWDDQMNRIFEKNLVDPEINKNQGLVGYHYSDDISNYEDRVGPDPLYIRATEVYGRNRTDPIIKHKDALKILTVPENVKLMQEGKLVILLDKENIVYDISVPEKDLSYYVKYNAVKQYFYENKVPGITISDSIDGILFSVDLKFYPDSSELLPSEKPRIRVIAENLTNLLMDDGYTILIEGHTADVGKPVGQLNLSIERTRTVMNALIEEGLDEKLFTYKGYGGTLPVASNETEEGRAQNRRVDITARPRATYIQRDWQ